MMRLVLSLRYMFWACFLCLFTRVSSTLIKNFLLCISSCKQKIKELREIVSETERKREREINEIDFFVYL